jgi:hypothetical protein
MGSGVKLVNIDAVELNRIFSVSMKDGKKYNAEIWEGTNIYGDGPERYVGTIKSYEDAEQICALHNKNLKQGL